jgi:soluble epoxide hydrolase/lipid-phosphate phosphatase
VRITEHVLRSPRHTTSYLAAGPPNGALMIFVHGWPATARTWKHQLHCFAALGFRVVAPDMRGYGNSTVHGSSDAYAQEHVVADMLELLAHLGRHSAVWIGHDWGSPTVWNLAAHHPDSCVAVANLCVPYARLERGLDALLSSVNRTTYPAETYPAGQFDYMAYYEQHADQVIELFDSAPASVVKAFYRRGDQASIGTVSRTAVISRDGGWFGGAGSVPDVPLDTAVLDEVDHAALAASFARNGFAGPTAYYLNHAANRAFASRAPGDGHLDLPVLFVGAAYDQVADVVTTDAAEPMRRWCRDLTEITIDAGHWVALEQPEKVNAVLAHWLATRTGSFWPSGLP